MPLSPINKKSDASTAPFAYPQTGGTNPYAEKLTTAIKLYIDNESLKYFECAAKEEHLSMGTLLMLYLKFCARHKIDLALDHNYYN